MTGGTMQGQPIDDQLRGEFPAAAKQAVYDVIALRRDIRNFRPDPVPEPALRRILEAAHRAGSVGLMQPWDFVILRSPARRATIYDLFRRATERAARHYEGDQRATYASLKLQGILDAPLCVCVTCDSARGGPHVLGRDSIPETDRYSTCLAVENLWLAARAEGIGVGWMSIVDNTDLAQALALPPAVIPIAFLCIGYPVEFSSAPMLEATGWRQRLRLDSLVHEERWGGVAVGARDICSDKRGRHDAGAAGPMTEPSLDALLTAIVPADPGGVRAARLRQRLDALAMPRGSLGELEALAIRLGCAQGRDIPETRRKRVLVFAADHGVSVEGVSAFQRGVTARLCYNMVAGGAVVNALLRSSGTPLEVIDVGVDHTFDPAMRLRHAKVARGTANISHAPAMTRMQAMTALTAGAAAVFDGPASDVIAVGEVGIGNTTSAAALYPLLLGTQGGHYVVGTGTGIGERTRERKRAIIARAVARAQAHALDPLDFVAEVGGFEIAALAGAILAAASRRTAVLLDGYITGAAALLATALAPAVPDYLIAAHRSAEPGHEMALERLGLKPLLTLAMRLGEASAAALALPIVDAAAALLRDVRTFREAGIDPPMDYQAID
jgi:nicotinate-nucleotide--dimethylbenzimidazole phosphoribosyltransferase